MSPISSRNRVPPSACSKRPRRIVCAPVKAPRSWPNSSDSSKSFGIAAVLIATKGPLPRGLCLCSARATNSLPAPDSPVINTVTLLWLRRPMARNTSCMAGACPNISGICVTRSSLTSSRTLSSTARRINSIALGRSKGLGRYSKAPPWKADTALSRSEYAVMMMTGRPGMRCLTAASRSRPEPPGMRMSLTSTCGPPWPSSASSACSTSRGPVKLRVGRPSRCKAFSSTKRMDWSSSAIQIGFIERLSVCSAKSSDSWQRNQDLEIRTTGLAVALDQAMVLLHKGLGQREPQSRAAFPAGHERVEGPALDRVRYAGPVVHHMQFQCQAITLFAKGHLTADAGPERDLRIALRHALCQRLCGVVRNVEHGLDQLFTVPPKLGDRDVVVAHHFEAFGELGQDQRAHPFAHFVDVHVTHHMRA